MTKNDINLRKSRETNSDFGLDFQVIGGNEAKERGYRSPKTISAAAKAAIELFQLEEA